MDAATETENAESPLPAESAEDSGRAADNPEPEKPAKPAPKRFDFRHPTFLSSTEWRKVRIELEEFVESAAALLSTYLRLDFGFQLGRLETLTFSEFTAELPAPTHLTLFKLEPLRGISLLEIRPSVGFGIVDRLLGGPGHPLSLERNLTEMEVALMDQFVQILLDEWCKQWTKHQELRSEILGHENNPKFLQSSSGDTVLFVITLEARMGECVGQMQLAFPCNTLEPVIRKLAATAPAPAQVPAVSTPSSPATAAPSGPKWNRSLDGVPLTFTARCPSFKSTTRQLLELKPGHVLELKAEAAEQIELCIGKQAKFKGRLGARENKRAVQITEICKL